MLLENKTAVVYGASGAIGSAVARAYARGGSHVHLVARTPAPLQALARTIRDAGGVARATALDVLDHDALQRHVSEIGETDGGIDVCFNATSNDDIQGTTFLDLAFEEFMQPVTKALTTHHAITTAVAPHMARRGRGVILVMAGGREAIPRLGGSHVAWSALAGPCRQLAADLGPHGIRVAWLLSSGSPPPGDHPDGQTRLTERGLIPRHQPSLKQVADVATYVASDAARTITAAEINLTGGLVVD